MTRNRARGVIGTAMAAIAAIAAVISYNDGLFVARLAGNHGWTGYLYPLLPDGLIVVCLAALYEAAQRKLNRPRWATAGLVLGISLTLAQNTGAGAAHGVLDALMDGMVPVVFFVAVEVLIWHVRAGRVTTPGRHDHPMATDGQLPRDWLDETIRALRSQRSERETADALGISRGRVATAMTTTSLNGDGPR